VVSRAIDANERFADGQITERELSRARSTALAVATREHGATVLAFTAHAAGYAAYPSLDILSLSLKHAVEAAALQGARKGAERRAQCGLLRDVAGNPFRPAPLDPALRAWKDGLLVALAQSIYDEKRFGDLPILADALEEAGSTEDLLAHCRDGGDHVRGCWVIDQLLARE
jgi:hypothetical protein